MIIIIILLALLVIVCGLGALASWLSLLGKFIDALAVGGIRGVVSFIRLTVWIITRLIRLSRWMYRHTKYVGLRTAQHSYVWFAVWAYLIREWYIASELRKRASR